MARQIAWFSAGAASAVATKLMPDAMPVYCETGSEDEDNGRFLMDCQQWLGRKINRIRSDKYRDTWDVWEKRRYLSGIAGAPCTKALKIEPRLKFQQPDDIHILGFTTEEKSRADIFREEWPGMDVRFPLIERGLTKAACLAMIQQAGIKPPRVYAMGFPNANCIPCVKATSPAYWALVREKFPAEFARMVAKSRALNVKLCRLPGGVRAFIDEIPADFPTTKPTAPECDFLCHIAEQDMEKPHD